MKRVCIKIDKFSGERMDIWDVLYENHCGHAGEKRGSMISLRSLCHQYNLEYIQISINQNPLFECDFNIQFHIMLIWEMVIKQVGLSSNFVRLMISWTEVTVFNSTEEKTNRSGKKLAASLAWYDAMWIKTWKQPRPRLLMGHLKKAYLNSEGIHGPKRRKK